MHNKTYANHSPQLNIYKGQPKITPSKMVPSQNCKIIEQYSVSTQMTTLSTNRSSVGGSNGSHYNSLNQKYQEPNQQILSNPRMSPYMTSKQATTFEPIMIQNERGRLIINTSNQNSRTPSHNLIPSPSQNNSIHFSDKKKDQIINTPTQRIFKNYDPRNISPLNSRTPERAISSLSSASIKQKVVNLKTDTSYNNDFNQYPPCINHPEKRSKYRLPQDQSLSMCSKCAVTMVGQGFKVEEIFTSQKDSGKSILSQEIEEFLEKVGLQVSNTGNILSSLSSKKDEIRRYYEQQLTKVQCFFNLIGEQMDVQKQSIEQRLQANFQKINSLYDEQLSTLQKAMDETGNMQKDIELNVDRIIKQIELQPFREIMTAYKQNLELYIAKLVEVQKLPVNVIRVKIPDIDDNQNRYKQMFQSIANEIEIVNVKTSLVKRNSDLNTEGKTEENQTIHPQNLNNSLYVSFDDREQFQRNKKPVIINDENINTSNRISSSVRVATVKLYEEKKKPFKYLFEEKEAIFQKNDESQYEEGSSQMIEKEDIENNYNLMLCENESEQEDIQSHLVEMNKNLGGIPLFCSPQFKDH